MPVEVVASGPRVTGIAARHADTVVLALGAEPERLAWGIEVARKARIAAGLDSDILQFGAYIQCAAHPGANVAREWVRGGSSTLARFSMWTTFSYARYKILRDGRLIVLCWPCEFGHYYLSAQRHNITRQAIQS